MNDFNFFQQYSPRKALSSALDANIISPGSEIIAEVSDQIRQSDKCYHHLTKYRVYQVLPNKAEAEPEENREQKISSQAMVAAGNISI